MNVSLCECGCMYYGGGTIYGQQYYAYFKIYSHYRNAPKACVSAE